MTRGENYLILEPTSTSPTAPAAQLCIYLPKFSKNREKRTAALVSTLPIEESALTMPALLLFT